MGSSLQWLGVDSGTTTVVLVVRAIDCVSCSVPNYSLRRVRTEVSSLIAVAPSADAAAVSQSLAVQRLPFALQPLGGGSFQAAFGDLALPALLVAEGGIVSGILPLDSPGAGPLADRLEDLLAGVIFESVESDSEPGER